MNKLSLLTESASLVVKELTDLKNIRLTLSHVYIDCKMIIDPWLRSEDIEKEIKNLDSRSPVGDIRDKLNKLSLFIIQCNDN